MEPPPDLHDLGEALSQERKSKGFTQKEVVARVSTYYSDERSYRRIEQGEQRPSRNALLAILEKGLLIKDQDRVTQMLALGGYVPSTGMEALQQDAPRVEVAVRPAETVVAPVPCAPPIASFWDRINLRFGPKLPPAIVVGSFIIGGALAALSQESAQVMATAILYGCLFAVSILLESAFDAAKPSNSVAATIFGLTMVTSVAALAIDSWLARIGVAAALPLAFGIFLLAAGAQWTIARSTLSESAIVPTTRFHAHTAQAAHLKNTTYFLVIVVIFWLPPTHCINVLRREMQAGHAAWVRSVLSRSLLLGQDFVCFSPQWLWFGLLFLVLLAIPMAIRLLENLKSDPKLNTYTALLYLRGIIYFLLILVCLVWYSSAIASLSD